MEIHVLHCWMATWGIPHVGYIYIYRDNHIPNALYPHKMAPLLLLLAINFLLDDKVGAVLSTDSTFMATEIKFIRSAWW